MIVRILSLLAFLFATVLSVSAQTRDEIVIGAIGPFSGPGSANGIDLRQGLEFALQEINAEGGIEIDGKKRKVVVLFEDSQARPEVGLSAAQKLILRDKVDIVIGDMFSSSVALAIMDFVADSNKVMLTGNPVSQEIAKKIASDLKRYGNVWKFMFNADAFATSTYETINYLLAQKAISAPNKTIAHISEETDYGKSQVEMLNAIFKKNGWNVVSTDFIPSGNSDFYPQLSKLRSVKPDVIVSSITALNSGAALVKQMKEQGVAGFHFGIFYPSRPEFLKAAGKAAEGLVHAPLYFDPVNDPKGKEFDAKMRPFAKKDVSTSHFFGYCNGRLLFDAIKRAGSVETKSLSKALSETDFRCLQIRWVFRPDDHSPVMGPQHFAVPSAQIQDGGWHAIWPETLATSKYRP
ncbi:MAG: ABC transporter substrate-binding protein [Xanthobacteraceae bacterium]|jgi:branched-chain amino acid transport system substrate-binding protein